jgi:hypothetical protein
MGWLERLAATILVFVAVVAIYGFLRETAAGIGYHDADPCKAPLEELREVYWIDQPEGADAGVVP